MAGADADRARSRRSDHVLTSLSLRGLGVIDEAEVEFGPGLTVITGETGAGKTMVLTGLALLLGGRTDAGSVRRGFSAAHVDGRFDAPTWSTDITRALEESGGSLDEDGSLLLARTVSAEGRSRAHIGGRGVPAATLAEVGQGLIAVHGQDDQHRLLHPAEQRRALDRFGGLAIAQALDAYAASYASLIDVMARLRDVTEHSAERAREAADLADLLAVIDSVRPQPGEEEALRLEADRLGHVDELMVASESALTALRAESERLAAAGASDLVGGAADALGRAAERDPNLADLRGRLLQVQADLEEIAVDLLRYQAHLDADPGRLAHVEERRSVLAGLRRRCERSGAPLDTTDLATWVDHARARLDELGDDDALIHELSDARDAMLAATRDRAQDLSLLRREAAARLAESISEELAALAMAKARIVVDVRPRPVRAGAVSVVIDGVEMSLDRHGADEVELLLIPRESSAPRPLGKGASGGERSRIMLALEVVFAGLDPVPTFVFDEVDAGVGGKAAVEVGRRLARLSQESQVIVVTHLPQVASFATRHLVVRPGEAVTSSDVVEVKDQERQRELARMLAGQEDSATALAHAAELLDAAQLDAPGTRDTRGAKNGAARVRRAPRQR